MKRFALGLAYRVWNTTRPALPLSTYRNHSFKLFGVDTGLLAAQAALPARAVLDGNAVFTHFKGALAEQFVQQELRATGDEPATWMPSNSTAEIDFLIQLDQTLIPIEVKAEENLRSKSLKQFFTDHPLSRPVRISMSDYRKQEWLVNIPLYAAERIADQ